jgi:putative tricarboxylic transport membrane protein
MSEHPQDRQDGNGVVSNRTMNIAVAVGLVVVAGVVMVSCYRLGAGWEKNVGPQSGYFPFYVALIMFVSGGATLLQSAFLHRRQRGDSFVSRSELNMVLHFLIPIAVFVILALYIGIYISTVVFITYFMMWHGRYSLYRTIPVALAVPIVLFVVFEIWFLVPLPKGPIEAWLGF